METRLCMLAMIPVLTGSLILGSCDTIDHVKLSKPEKEFYKRLTEDCHCRVSPHHNYEIVNGLSKTDSANFSIDLTQHKNYKNIPYNQTEDWCYQDSLFLADKSKHVVKEFKATSQYARFYRKITIYFSSYENVGTKDILTNERCTKEVIYYIDQERLVMKTRLLQ